MSFSLSRLGTHAFRPILISLGCASLACAQSLEHRPPAKPAPAPVPAAPASQMPILPSGTSLQVEVLRHYPQDLSLDAEGTITPHNKSSVIAHNARRARA